MWEQGPGDEVNLPCLAELTHFLIYSFNISIFFPCYSKRPAIHFDWVQNSPWEECKHAVWRKRQTCDGMYYVACSSPINRPEIRATERSVHNRYISGKAHSCGELRKPTLDTARKVSRVFIRLLIWDTWRFLSVIKRRPASFELRKNYLTCFSNYLSARYDRWFTSRTYVLALLPSDIQISYFLSLQTSAK